LDWGTIGPTPEKAGGLSRDLLIDEVKKICHQTASILASDKSCQNDAPPEAGDSQLEN
jgi:hypothetical protein